MIGATYLVNNGISQNSQHIVDNSDDHEVNRYITECGFLACIDIHHFHPEEITVLLYNNSKTIVVEGSSFIHFLSAQDFQRDFFSS